MRSLSGGTIESCCSDTIGAFPLPPRLTRPQCWDSPFQNVRTLSEPAVHQRAFSFLGQFHTKHHGRGDPQTPRWVPVSRLQRRQPPDRPGQPAGARTAAPARLFDRWPGQQVVEPLQPSIGAAARPADRRVRQGGQRGTPGVAGQCPSSTGICRRPARCSDAEMPPCFPASARDSRRRCRRGSTCRSRSSRANRRWRACAKSARANVKTQFKRCATIASWGDHHVPQHPAVLRR